MRYLVMVLFFFGASASAATVEVAQKDKQFAKESVELKVGDTLRITNEDDTVHHIMYKWDGKTTSHKQKKKSDPESKPYEAKFDKAGETMVRCAIHPKMKLKVVVKK